MEEFFNTRGSFPGHTSNTFRSSLPEEIWLRVFESSCLFQEDLIQLTLTQRSFRWLAQPILFVNIRFCHYDGDDYCEQTSQYVSWYKERLNFILLDRISPSVEFLAFTSLRKTGKETEDFMDCSDIYAALFTALPRLPNVSKIFGMGLVFTQPMITGLYSLPRLQQLRFYFCYTAVIEPIEGSARSSLALFKFTEGTSRGGPAPSFLPWAPLLNFKRTRHVSLYGSSISKSFFRSIANGPVTEKLETLNVPLEVISSPYFIEAMAKCISLVNLILHIPAASLTPSTPSDLDAANIAKLLDSGALPHLQYLKVHHVLALPFVRRRSLTTLYILSCMTSALAANLFTDLIPNQPRLTILDVVLSDVTVPLLTPILVGLQSIDSLNIHVKGDIPNDVVIAMCEMMEEITLPPTLQCLSIMKWLWAPEEELLLSIRFPTLDSRLRQQCPRLLDFRVAGGSLGIKLTSWPLLPEYHSHDNIEFPLP